MLIGIYFAFNIVGQIFLTKMFMVLYINNFLGSKYIKDLLQFESPISSFVKSIKRYLANKFVKGKLEEKQKQSVSFSFLIVTIKFMIRSK